MSFSRIIIIGAIALFSVIAIASVFKKSKNKHDVVFDTKHSKVQEIVIQDKKEKVIKKEIPAKVVKNKSTIATTTKKALPPKANQEVKPAQVVKKAQIENSSKVEKQVQPDLQPQSVVQAPIVSSPKKDNQVKIDQVVKQDEKVANVKSDENLPDSDIIDRLFATDSSRLPIVETIVYNSRVPWQKGRPAWIADYAAHYSTTRHFIARSLNKKADYFTQKVNSGDRFNVFKEGKNISFYLLIDLNRSKLWFYYLDNDSNERTLLKTYKVGLGRKDSKRSSGSLTPTGKYSLGSKVAIYKPNILGYFQDKKIEMIKVFGTRWIPFDKELENCSEISKGLGIHGAPWEADSNGELKENRSTIGKFDSDGCIRLFSEDIEEIFAIVISKPTTIELVNDFHDAKLPGIEKKY